MFWKSISDWKVLSYFPIEILNYGSKWHLLAVLFGLLVTRLLSFYEASLFLNESIWRKKIQKFTLCVKVSGDSGNSV